MERPPNETRELLSGVHGGDDDALRTLLQRHLPWIRARVHARLGAKLRQKTDTEDLVQEAAVEVLRYGPRFVVSDDEQFRGMLARIVENVVCDQFQWFNAARRRLAQEQPLPTESVLDLDARGGPRTTASQSFDRREREHWVRLGLELLEPDYRGLILMREVEGLSFEEMGKRLGTAPDAARMRFHRALKRLADRVTKLRVQGIARLLEER